MQVYGPSHLHGAQPINGPHTSRLHGAQSTTGPARTSDQLDLSEAGQLAARLNDLPDIRTDRVAALKAAIESGTYETADKLDGALERLLDEIG